MIEINNLVKKYKKEETNALNIQNLKLPNRGLIAFFGRSGCGKTTLFNILAGIIKPTSGEVLIDTEDVERIKHYKWYISIRKSKLYCYGTIQGKKIALHRFILNTTNVVDHINGNSLDNRKSNLREVTAEQNCYNKKIANKFFAGIIKTNYKREKPYMVFFTHKGKELFLGSFPTYEEAAFCRLQKEYEIWKEFGVHQNLYYILNHPSPIEELKKVLRKECNRIG